MPDIHPSSYIHPGAELADDVKIGPLCYVGDQVKLGSGCVLHNHVSLEGPSTFGKNNEFFPGSVVGQKTQDLKYKEEPTYLEVGDGNVFREHTVIHRGTLPGTKTIIGNNNLFLHCSHVAHDCIIHNNVIMSGYAAAAGHVEICDYAIIGGYAAIHQFVKVGEHCMIGGVGRIPQDVPPFMIAEGQPAVVRGVNVVGMRRRGFTEEDVLAIKQCYKKLFLHKGCSVSEGVEELQNDPKYKDNAYLKRLIEFITTSERGFIH